MRHMLTQCRKSKASVGSRIRKLRQWPRQIRAGNRQGFGLNEVIGIAAAIIIAVIVVIPGLRSFAESLMTSLTGWWNDMASQIFTSP